MPKEHEQQAGVEQPAVFPLLARWQRYVVGALFAGVVVLMVAFLAGPGLFFVEVAFSATRPPLGTGGAASSTYNIYTALTSGRASMPFLSLAAVMVIMAFIPVLMLSVMGYRFLPLAFGAFYVYPDRLGWSSFRRTRWLYFSDAVKVKAGATSISLWESGVHFVLFYRMPRFVELHRLLCRYSEAFRRSQELRVPNGLSTTRYVLSVAAPFLLGFGLFFYAFDSGSSREVLADEWPVIVGAAVFTLVLAPALFVLLPAEYLFKADCIEVRRTFRTRRYDVSQLVSVALKNRGLVQLTFRDARLNISQTLVPYPIPVLAEALRGQYLPEASDKPQ